MHRDGMLCATSIKSFLKIILMEFFTFDGFESCFHFYIKLSWLFDQIIYCFLKSKLWEFEVKICIVDVRRRWIYYFSCKVKLILLCICWIKKIRNFDICKLILYMRGNKTRNFINDWQISINDIVKKLQLKIIG